MLTSHQKRQQTLVILLSFTFMLFRQADMLLISPLTSQIMADFHINEVRMGSVVSGALIVGTIIMGWAALQIPSDIQVRRDQMRERPQEIPAIS